MDERKRKIFVRGIIAVCILPIVIGIIAIIWNRATDKGDEIVVREDDIITKDSSEKFYRFANYVLHGDDNTNLITGGTASDIAKAYIIDLGLARKPAYKKHYKELAKEFRDFALNDETYNTGDSLGYYLKVTGNRSEIVEAILFDSPFYTEKELYSWFLALGSQGIQNKLEQEYASFKNSRTANADINSFMTLLAKRDENLVAFFNAMDKDGCLRDAFGSWKEGDEPKSYSDSLQCERDRGGNSDAIRLFNAYSQTQLDLNGEIATRSAELIMNIYSVASGMQKVKK